jgi:hypothetical protein
MAILALDPEVLGLMTFFVSCGFAKLGLLCAHRCLFVLDFNDGETLQMVEDDKRHATSSRL